MTKGAIYGHFASKEDLMLTAMEAAPAPDYSTTLGDESLPLQERVAEFSRAVSAEQPGDEAELAVMLEFWAALLRSPDALWRYSARVEGRLRALADLGADDTVFVPDHGGPGLGHRAGDAGGATDLQATGPRHRHPGGVQRAFLLLADLYQEQ